jgi:two-component system chemotaxis response regulator CheB
MAVDSRLCVKLREGRPVSGHRPSGDVLLQSLAHRSNSHTVGVILSGMGSDGAVGMAAIHRAGGTTYVQDRASSIVYGMPQSAIDLGVVDHVVSLDNMAQRLLKSIEAILE